MNVCSYGASRWQTLARERAMPSAMLSSCAHVRQHHSDTLQHARNEALAQTDSEWVCFLDADDELEPGYFEAMNDTAGDLRAPAVRYVHEDATDEPAIPRVAGHAHDCSADCLPYGNWMVIGTVARTELLTKVGGFNDYPIFEDWDLWLRCYLEGALIGRVPAAVYRAHVRSDSRNRGKRELGLETHRQIAAANGVPLP